MLNTEQPGFARLVVQRREEVHRLAGLTRRVEEIDPDRHRAALAALQEAARATAERIEQLDCLLAAPTPPEVDASRLRVHVAHFPHDGIPMDVREAKAAVRARLLVVLTALSSLPPGCDQAATNLRKCINIELRRLDKLKAIERRAKQGSGP